MAINFDSYEKAIVSLEKALNLYNNNKNDELADMMQDSVIKRFEYTYEMSLKSIRRYLKTLDDYNPEEAKNISFQNFIRIAIDKGLVKSNVATWKDYRESRNITSHNYDAGKAGLIIKTAELFSDEARYILTALERNISNDD